MNSCKDISQKMYVAALPTSWRGSVILLEHYTDGERRLLLREITFKMKS